MQQQNLSETIANQCIAAICDEMAHQYGYYYITDENSRRKWCEKLQYHDNANQAAIECARVTVMTIVGTTSNATNPEFLKVVLQKVAKHLVKYTMKNPLYFTPETVEADTDSEQTKHAKRKIRRKLAMKYLIRQLITENKYLAGIATNHNTKSRTVQSQRKKRNNTVTQAVKIHNEIHNMFGHMGLNPKQY